MVHRFNRVMGKFVTSVSITDHNHELSESLYKLYADQRRPTGHLADEVDNMLAVNGSATLVAQVLHKEGLAVRVKDIHNRKQRLAQTGETLPSRLRNLLSASHIHHRMLENDNHSFQALFFQTDRQRAIFAKYGEMVQLDATYKTNNMRYPLYTLLVEDGHGVGQPVAFGLLAREDQNHIEHFLNYFAECNNLENTQCVITDKDMAEINAVNKCWKVPVLICYFHVLRAIDRHLASTQMSSDEKELCCLVMHMLLSNYFFFGYNTVCSKGLYSSAFRFFK